MSGPTSPHPVISLLPGVELYAPCPLPHLMSTTIWKYRSELGLSSTSSERRRKSLPTANPPVRRARSLGFKQPNPDAEINILLRSHRLIGKIYFEAFLVKMSVANFKFHDIEAVAIS